MAGLLRLIKDNFILIPIFMAYVFVTSGFIICFFMLIACILVWPFSKSLYRKIVIHLAYLNWSQLAFVAQWWSGSDCDLILHDPNDLDRYLGKEHSIAIMNHKYDIDWLLTWIITERLSLLGGTKIFGKSSLRFVPVVGWAWMFTESIFLKREWDKDKKIISRDLRYICDYPDGYWVTLLLFCEGTRFTREKHRLSMEVARSKGLPELKHHLLPRNKGFVQSMHGLKGKMNSILDVTVGFREDGASPSLMNVVRGRACHGEMYVRRIPLEEVPIDTDEACANWLQNLYREKDVVFDDFDRNGRFTLGHRVNLPWRYKDLLNWIVWAVLTGVPLFYFLWQVFTAGSLVLQVTIAIIIVSLFYGIRSMIAVSEIEKASSAYGSTINNNSKKSKRRL